MNIEEKRERLEKFCEERNHCYMCPLNHFSFCECNFENFSINVINEAYRIAFGGVEINLTEQNVMSDKSKEEINHPDRYAGGKFECIDVMQDVFGADAVKNFCILNALKYIWRAEKKNGIEDIKKAVWYLNKYIELGGESND